MSIEHIFLAFACLSLLAVIAAQDWLYTPLRNESISAGLTGPYHVLLDAAYVPVALALVVGFTHRPLMEVFAVVSALALVLVAVTNTAHTWVDSITGGQHALWHSRFTIVVFVAALALQLAGDRGAFWWLTAANIAIPAAAYGYFEFKHAAVEGITIAPSPAAEKLYVLGLCVWLMVWALH